MIKNSRFIIVYLLIICTGLYTNLHSNISVPINRPFNEFPTYNKGWRMVSQSYLDERTLKKLKPTDYMLRQYVDPSGHAAYLYIGYHNGGKDSGAIHSPKSCLPLSGWYRVKGQEINIHVGNKELNLVSAVYQTGEVKELFIYWYQMKGKSLTDEYLLRVAEIISSILYRRKDSAFIRISVPFEVNEEEAFSMGIKFIKDFYPIIDNFLPA